MSDYIKMSDAIKVVRHITFECIDADTRQKLIEAIPSIEPKRGEWVDNGDRYFRCSLCGTKDTDKWHWCHGCGAQMKGADDE